MRQVTEMVGSGPFRFPRLGVRLGLARRLRAVRRLRAAGGAGGVDPPAGSGAGFDRVEWQSIPDPATAAAALQKGEVDWWEQALPDLIPMLTRTRGVRVQKKDPYGFVALGRFNALQKPFDNPRLRHVVLTALRQADYIQAIMGDDQGAWRACEAMFSCGMPGVSELGAGGDRGGGPRVLAGGGAGGGLRWRAGGGDQPDRLPGDRAARATDGGAAARDGVRGGPAGDGLGQRAAAAALEGAGRARRLERLPHKPARRVHRQPGAQHRNPRGWGVARVVCGCGDGAADGVVARGHGAWGAAGAVRRRAPARAGPGAHAAARAVSSCGRRSGTSCRACWTARCHISGTCGGDDRGGRALAAVRDRGGAPGRAGCSFPRWR